MAEEMVSAAQSIAAVDKMNVSDYEAWLRSEKIEVVEFKGSDWEIVGNKDTLVDKPFVIARVKFNDGDSGTFVSVCAYTIPDGEKVIFNDGSTGVYDQLKSYVDKTGRTTAISCPKGLRVSRYTYTDPKTGKDSPAATYYLA
jgi:DNA-binding cell septation regulator SpoVG